MEGPLASSDGSGGKADEGPAPESAALAPAYALTLSSHVVTRDPAGETTTYDSRIDGYLVPTIGEAGTSLSVRPCHVELPEADGHVPEVSDETVRARPPVILAAILSRDDEGRLLVSTETGALELGVALDDPLLDALPTEGDDPRVIDDDDDGEVGVTIDLDGWEVYLGARARLWLSGSVDPDSGVIHGDAELSIDVEVYGDDIPFVDVRSRVAASQNSDTEVSEADNGFTLAPLEAAPDSCAAL